MRDDGAARTDAHVAVLAALEGDYSKIADGGFEDGRARVVGDAAHDVEPPRSGGDDGGVPGAEKTVCPERREEGLEHAGL